MKAGNRLRPNKNRGRAKTMPLSYSTFSAEDRLWGEQFKLSETLLSLRARCFANQGRAAAERSLAQLDLIAWAANQAGRAGPMGRCSMLSGLKRSAQFIYNSGAGSLPWP